MPVARAQARFPSFSTRKKSTSHEARSVSPSSTSSLSRPARRRPPPPLSPSPSVAHGRRIAPAAHLPVAGNWRASPGARRCISRESRPCRCRHKIHISEQHLHLSLILLARQNLVGVGAAELPHPPPYSSVRGEAPCHRAYLHTSFNRSVVSMHPIILVWWL